MLAYFDREMHLDARTFPEFELVWIRIGKYRQVQLLHLDHTGFYDPDAEVHDSRDMSNKIIVSAGVWVYDPWKDLLLGWNEGRGEGDWVVAPSSKGGLEFRRESQVADDIVDGRIVLVMTRYRSKPTEGRLLSPVTRVTFSPRWYRYYGGTAGVPFREMAVFALPQGMYEELVSILQDAVDDIQDDKDFHVHIQ